MLIVSTTTIFHIHKCLPAVMFCDTYALSHFSLSSNYIWHVYTLSCHSHNEYCNYAIIHVGFVNKLQISVIKTSIVWFIGYQLLLTKTFLRSTLKHILERRDSQGQTSNTQVVSLLTRCTCHELVYGQL